MAQFNMPAAGWTPAAFADGATLSNSNHESIRSWAVTVVDRVIEVFIGGEATSSTVNRMALRRNSSQSATPTNVVPGPLSPFSQACLATGYVVATTNGVVASTSHLLNLAFNAFGGIIRWVAAPGEEHYIVGATAPNNEISLSSITGTGIVSSHLIFEEL